MRWILGLFLALAVVVVACSSDDDSADGSPSTTVAGAVGDASSLGLATVTLPTTEAEVVAVFAAMPDEVLGLERLADDPETVARYGGERNVVTSGLAADFDTGTVLADLSAFSGERGAVIEASQLDPDAEVVWLVGSFEDDGGAGTVYVATWGAPDGDWIFSAGGESAELRAALVEAFIEAT